MLGEHGEVFVMDWGIAKILPHGAEHFPYSNLIRPNIGSVVGTPEYIAPEQAHRREVPGRGPGQASSP